MESKDEFARLQRWLDCQERADIRSIAFTSPSNRLSMAELPNTIDYSIVGDGKDELDRQLSSALQEIILSEWICRANLQPLPQQQQQLQGRQQQHQNESVFDLQQSCALDNQAYLMDRLKTATCLALANPPKSPAHPAIDERRRPLLDLTQFDLFGDEMAGNNFSSQPQISQILNDTKQFLKLLLDQVAVRNRQLIETKSVTACKRNQSINAAVAVNRDQAGGGKKKRGRPARQRLPLIGTEMVLSAASQVDGIPLQVLHNSRLRHDILFAK